MREKVSRALDDKQTEEMNEKCSRAAYLALTDYDVGADDGQQLAILKAFSAAHSAKKEFIQQLNSEEIGYYVINDDFNCVIASAFAAKTQDVAWGLFAPINDAGVAIADFARTVAMLSSVKQLRQDIDYYFDPDARDVEIAIGAFDN